MDMENQINKNESEKNSAEEVKEVPEFKPVPESAESNQQKIDAAKKSAEEVVKALDAINATETLETGVVEEIPGKAEAQQKSGFFNKLKGMFKGKELSPEEQYKKERAAIADTIKELTHISTYDGGLLQIGGGTNMSVSDKMKDLVALNKKLNKTENGPEAVALTKEKMSLIGDIRKEALEALDQKYNRAA